MPIWVSAVILCYSGLVNDFSHGRELDFACFLDRVCSPHSPSIGFPMEVGHLDFKVSQKGSDQNYECFVGGRTKSTKFFGNGSTDVGPVALTEFENSARSLPGLTKRYGIAKWPHMSGMDLGMIIKMLLAPPELRPKYRFRLGSRPLELRFWGQLIRFGALF